MFRRCISLLAIGGLLASQLVSTAHAHGPCTVEQQREHDATPHFHRRRHDHAGHDHAGHSHTHHTHGKGHTHAGHEHAVASKGVQQTQTLPGSYDGIVADDEDHHDSDAIFVPHTDAPKHSTAKGQATSVSIVGCVAVLAWNAHDTPSGPRLSPYLHPPDIVLDASETYLTLRNLRL
jgi:hypothetical protein